MSSQTQTQNKRHEYAADFEAEFTAHLEKKRDRLIAAAANEKNPGIRRSLESQIYELDNEIESLGGGR